MRLPVQVPPTETSAIVTAVMPTYNKAAYVRAAIDSVVAQTFGDWELIVVDDGSTDDTPSVLATFSDPRIRVFTLPSNVGRSAARNHALRRARGRYIAICDSDDVSAPTRFERHVTFLESHPDVAIVSAHLQAFTRSSTARVMFPLDHASIRRRFALGKMGLAHGASMIRAECFLQLGLYCEDLPSAEDFELLNRFSARYQCRTLPEVLLDYRQAQGLARIKSWEQSGLAHRYALYRSACDDGSAVMSFQEFSERWQTKLAVWTLDLLRWMYFSTKARTLSTYVLR